MRSVSLSILSLWVFSIPEHCTTYWFLLVTWLLMLRGQYQISLRAVWIRFLVFHCSFWHSYVSFHIVLREPVGFFSVVPAFWETSFLFCIWRFLVNRLEGCFVGGDLLFLLEVVRVCRFYVCFPWTTLLDFSSFCWVCAFWISAE